MKHYKPRKLEKTIKEIIDREYQTDGIYVVVEQVNYNYEFQMIEVKVRYGRAETENFHSFQKQLDFVLRGNESYTYIKGMVDGIIQYTESDVGCSQ